MIRVGRKHVPNYEVVCKLQNIKTIRKGWQKSNLSYHYYKQLMNFQENYGYNLQFY